MKRAAPVILAAIVLGLPAVAAATSSHAPTVAVARRVITHWWDHHDQAVRVLSCRRGKLSTACHDRVLVDVCTPRCRPTWSRGIDSVEIRNGRAVVVIGPGSVQVNVCTTAGRTGCALAR